MENDCKTPSEIVPSTEMEGKKVKEREHQIREVTEGIEMSSFTVRLIHESSSFAVIPSRRSINRLIVHFIPLLPVPLPLSHVSSPQLSQILVTLLLCKVTVLDLPPQWSPTHCHHKGAIKQQYNPLCGTICYLDVFGVSGFDQTADWTLRSDVFSFFVLASCPPWGIVAERSKQSKASLNIDEDIQAGTDGRKWDTFMCDGDARPVNDNVIHRPVLSEKCFRRQESVCLAAFIHISNLRVEMQQYWKKGAEIMQKRVSLGWAERGEALIKAKSDKVEWKQTYNM